MSGPTTDVVDGVARMLDAAGVAKYVADGSLFQSTDTVITFKDLPPTPDRVVAITPHSVANDQPLITYGQRYLQLRFRGMPSDPNDVDDFADAAFAALHGATDLTFGSVHVTQILRFSSIPLGMDEQSRRWERADNYMLDLDWPTTANRPL